MSFVLLGMLCAYYVSQKWVMFEKSLFASDEQQQVPHVSLHRQSNSIERNLNWKPRVRINYSPSQGLLLQRMNYTQLINVGGNTKEVRSFIANKTWNSMTSGACAVLKVLSAVVLCQFLVKLCSFTIALAHNS